MPFLDHLEELRWRLLKSIVAVVLGAIAGFVVVTRYNVLELLIDPLRPLIGADKLNYLSPGDPFFVTIGLALTVGLLLAFPIVVSQVWAFVAPALLPREKRAIVPALYLGLLLFTGGVALAYYFALPMTLKFMMSFQTQSLQQSIVIGNYIGFVVKLLLAFGIMFELPVVVLVLSSLGLITSKFLSEKRRYAVAGIAVVSALVSPGDSITLLVLLMGPLVVLYELSIFLARFVERRRARALKAAVAAVVCALVFAAPASAQQQQPDTVKPKSTREIVRDKLRRLNESEVRDTTGRDTLAAPRERSQPTQRTQPGARPAQTPMDFPTDSTMRALLQLSDFAATQYRGAAARFAADSSRLVLFGKPDQKAGVARDGQTMTADSLLTFDQETSVACGYGKPVLSGEGADQPVESKLVCFNTRDKIGMALGARTQVSEGANWFITGDLYSREKNVYSHSAKFTDCSLEVPHYHFAAGEVKIVNDNVMVARNVTLNFGDVPVFWLPFMMQSLKQGRRSGLLMPEFSVNDIVRRSSSYNRRVRDVGFYWAISDHFGSKVALDWWSNNYTALEGSLDYNFLNHFISGGATFKRFWEASGSRQFSLAANHTWEPNERTSIRVDGQYVTSTRFVEQRSYDPRELRRSIRSNLGLSRRFDFVSMTLGASRTHHLSDDKVDYSLPSVSLSFPTVQLGRLGTWGSSASFSRSATDFANTDLDPSGLTGNAQSTLTFGKFGLSQSFSATDNRARQVVDEDSVIASDQRMTWSSNLNYQQRLIGTTTFTPGISLGGETVKSLRTNQQSLSAPVRIDANATLKMDLFGFWPGVGTLSRIRHRVSPSITYGYSPSPKIVAGDSLREAVFGRSGVRERNRLEFSLSQTIEGKYREDAKTDAQRADSAAIDSTTVDPTKPRRLPQARKVSILSLTTSSVVYDFVAARDDHGIQTNSITNSLNSDLLRGLQLTLTHELFKPVVAAVPGTPEVGTTNGTEREFAPHLRNVSATFSLSNNSWLFRFLGLGKKNEAVPPTGSRETPQPGEAQGGVEPTGTIRPEYGVIGNRARETGPPSRGPTGSWNASFSVTLERPRVSEDDAGTADRGSQIVNSQITFQPTQQWNVNWHTGYSFTTKKFNDHILTFTRQMHDWDANFDFVKAANGNFSFQFRVKLRANPDIKFDYNQRSNVTDRIIQNQ